MTSLQQEFAERGWCILRNGVSGAHLQALRVAFAAVVDATRVHASAPTALWQIPLQIGHHDSFLDHLDASTVRCVATILGCDNVRLLQHSLLEKHPGEGGEVVLHDDYRYVGFLQPANIVTLRLALTEEHAESGAMWVVDGSHQWHMDQALDVFADGLLDLSTDLDPDTRARIDAHKVRLDLAPGDVSIHHCRTLHGSPASEHGVRQTIIARVFDADCRVAPERLPPEARPWIRPDDEGRLSSTATPLLPLPRR